MLVDYRTIVEFLIRGERPSHWVIATEATVSKAMSDPILASFVNGLVRSGIMRVKEVEEHISIRALELARRSGVDVREVAEILTLLEGGF